LLGLIHKYKIYEPKRDEVSGEIRLIYSDEFNDFYNSLSIVKVVKAKEVVLFHIQEVLCLILGQEVTYTGKFGFLQAIQMLG
jgi:hypothetical protein